MSARTFQATVWDASMTSFTQEIPRVLGALCQEPEAETKYMLLVMAQLDNPRSGVLVQKNASFFLRSGPSYGRAALTTVWTELRNTHGACSPGNVPVSILLQGAGLGGKMKKPVVGICAIQSVLQCDDDVMFKITLAILFFFSEFRVLSWKSNSTKSYPKRADTFFSSPQTEAKVPNHTEWLCFATY